MYNNTSYTGNNSSNLTLGYNTSTLENYALTIPKGYSFFFYSVGWYVEVKVSAYALLKEVISTDWQQMTNSTHDHYNELNGRAGCYNKFYGPSDLTIDGICERAYSNNDIIWWAKESITVVWFPEPNNPYGHHYGIRYRTYNPSNGSVGSWTDRIEIAPNNTGNSDAYHWMSFKVPANYQFAISNMSNNTYAYGKSMRVRIITTTLAAGSEVEYTSKKTTLKYDS